MATRTISVAGGNWNAVGTWDEGAFPIAGDAVVARGGGDSGNVTINVASACASIILTNYVGTLTFTSTLTVTSTVTFVAGMTIAGTANLICTGSATLTSGGKTLSGGLQLGGDSKTYTLGDAWTITGTLTINATTAITFSGAYAIVAGNITISGAASLTLTVSGTMTTAGTLTFNSSSTTTIVGNFQWYCANCTIQNTETVTIANTMNVTGTLTIADASVLNGVGKTWQVGGLTATGNITTGSATIIMTGGTWQGAGIVGCSLSFAGDVTVSGVVYIGDVVGKTTTYTSGTITVAGSTLTIADKRTLNTSGMSWNNVTIAAVATTTLSSVLDMTGTLTISSTHTFSGAFGINCATCIIAVGATISLAGLLTVTGTMTMPDAACIFSGTAGWTVATLTNTAITSNRIWTFKNGITYTITTAWTHVQTAASTVRTSLVSGTPGTKYNLVLQHGATQKVFNVDPTDADSSGGQTIYSCGGTIVTSFNWSNSIGNGNNVIRTAGGEALTVAGITKDKDGNALGSCTVYLFRDNGNSTATFIAATTSNAVTGAYSFTQFAGSTYFVVAFLAGATPVMDTTDRTLVAV